MNQETPMTFDEFRADWLGLTAQAERFADMPAVPSLVHFPAAQRLRRVVVERPIPPPIHRICPTCGATFEDYTRKPNTVYCRGWCKTKMSYLKRDAAINLLAAQPGMDAETASNMVDQGGLSKVEKLLNNLGYTFQREKKEWLK